MITHCILLSYRSLASKIHLLIFFSFRLFPKTIIWRCFTFFFYFSHEGREKTQKRKPNTCALQCWKYIIFMQICMHALHFLKFFIGISSNQILHFDVISGSLVGIISHLTFWYKNFLFSLVQKQYMFSRNYTWNLKILSFPRLASCVTELTWDAGSSNKL